MLSYTSGLCTFKKQVFHSLHLIRSKKLMSLKWDPTGKQKMASILVASSPLKPLGSYKARKASSKDGNEYWDFEEGPMPCGGACGKFHHKFAGHNGRCNLTVSAHLFVVCRLWQPPPVVVIGLVLLFDRCQLRRRSRSRSRPRRTWPR